MKSLLENGLGNIFSEYGWWVGESCKGGSRNIFYSPRPLVRKCLQPATEQRHNNLESHVIIIDAIISVVLCLN